MMMWIHQPEAFAELSPYLDPQGESDFLAWAFPLIDYPASFYIGISGQVLDLMILLITNAVQYQPWVNYIIQILDLLVEADPTLEHEPRYISFRKRFV